MCADIDVIMYVKHRVFWLDLKKQVYLFYSDFCKVMVFP